MRNNILGMLVGAAIDRRDGEGGLTGALEGYLIQGVIRAATPLVVTFAIGGGVQYGLRRALHAITGDDDLKAGAISPDVRG